MGYTNSKRGQIDSAKKKWALEVVRMVLHRAQNGRCHICGQQLPARWKPDKMSLDHVWPTSRAGHQDSFFGNTMIAHQNCNALTKGNRRPTGCEIILLHAVNRRLGLPSHQTAVWDRPWK